MDYKLVAIDMDGTLLNNENDISERNRRAIEKAGDKGVYIVLATGRILKSALSYSRRLNLNKPIISCNGAVISDADGKIIYESLLDRETTRKLIEIGNKNNIYYHIYTEDAFYSNVYVEEVLKFYQIGDSDNSQIDYHLFEDPEEIINGDLNIYKFFFLDQDEKKLEILRNQLSELDNISISSSWSNNVEVMGKNTSKGHGLKYLCERLNISQEEVIAIGDNENDLPMIDYAGMGVAMDNAIDKVKAVADIKTLKNDEDGVARIIEKYILGEGDGI